MGIKVTLWWMILVLDGHFYANILFICWQWKKIEWKKMTVYATKGNIEKHCGGQPPQQEIQPLPPANPREFQGFPGQPRDKISTVLPWVCLWISSLEHLSREALRNHADRTSGSRLNWFPSMRRTGSSAFSYSAVNVTLGNNLCLICDSLWIQQFGVGLVSTTAQNLKMHACNIDLSNEVKQFDSINVIH